MNAEEPRRFRALASEQAKPAAPKFSVTAELVRHMQVLISDSVPIVEKGRESFLSEQGRIDQHAADAIVIKFHELADRMPIEVQQRHPEVAWDDLRGMRNKIGHNYRQTDYRIVWTTLTEDLPFIAQRLVGES